jgi:hypothetical protein
MSTNGTHEAPYTVCVAHLRSWLTECLAHANPKCPVCAGTGKEDCPDCNGMGRVDCKCGACGDEHQKDCTTCDGKGVLRCHCSSKDDPQFQIDFCGRILGYEQVSELLKALGSIDSEGAHVWANEGSACVQVEEVSRRRRRVGHVCVGVVAKTWQRCLSRYPVEQQPLPFVAALRARRTP